MKNYTKNETCCFTGHRVAKLPWKSNEKDERCVLLKTKMRDIVESLILSGTKHFICGMALGCDTYFAEIVLDLRSIYSDITLEAALPFKAQSADWSRNNRERYENILSKCDKITLLQEHYSRDCFYKRNKYMVDLSSVVVAVYSGNPGGTKYTLEYANKRGIDIIQIAV